VVRFTFCRSGDFSSRTDPPYEFPRNCLFADGFACFVSEYRRLSFLGGMVRFEVSQRRIDEKRRNDETTPRSFSHDLILSDTTPVGYGTRSDSDSLWSSVTSSPLSYPFEIWIYFFFSSTV